MSRRFSLLQAKSITIRRPANGLRVRWLMPARRALLLSVTLLCSLILGADVAVTLQAREPTVPLGRLVSAGHHRLHLYCTGRGSPTVVLEAALGGNHLDWIRMQPKLSKAAGVQLRPRRLRLERAGTEAAHS